MTPCKIPSPIGHFLRDESGAVTVDWVVLTAGVVGLFLAVAMPVIHGAITDGSARIGGSIDTASAFLTP